MSESLPIKIYRKLPSGIKGIIKGTYNATIGSEYARLVSAQLKYSLGFPKIKPGERIDISKFEQKIYSQNGEDGIIRAIFNAIGTTDKYCVEFGVEDGRECNTRYLVEKEGWKPLWMDGTGDNKKIMKEYITAENINGLFKKYGVPKEFDLLSIDIDYNTYWVWKAIEGYSPRVVIVEYNSQIPVNESKAVKYDPKRVWDGTSYQGGSLLAMVNLGKKKGYTLVCCDSNGVNAFFVRNDLIGEEKLGTIEELYRKPNFGVRDRLGNFTGHPKSNEKFVDV